MRLDIGLDTLILPLWLRRYGPLRRAPGTVLDRVSLHYYVLSAMFGAVLTGAFSLGMVVLKKSLDAGPLQIGIMSAIGPMSLLLGVFGSELVRGRDRRPPIAILGLLSRGVFLLFFLCQGAWHYIFIASTFNVANAMLIPAVTTHWQQNVSPRFRNALWGMTVSLTTAVSMATAFLVGWLLDMNHSAYRWIFPVAGLCGAIGILILVRMPYRGRYKLKRGPREISLSRVFGTPLKTVWQLMKTDRDFRHFEAAFFLYGCAFMIMTPILPMYIVDMAKMNYVQASISEGVLFQVGAIALSTFWGRRLDRSSPAALCVGVFLLLSLFPTLLLLGPSFATLGLPMPYTVYLSYAVYGIGMSGLGIAWTLAPLAFAGNEDASSYTGAHVTLTGVRGAIAPFSGALGYKYLGYQPVLAAAVVLFLLAATGMFLLDRKMRQRALSAASLPAG